MAVILPYLLTERTRIVFGRTHLDLKRNSYARFILKSFSSFGGDAITVKIKDSCRRQYLSTDRNHFRADTARPLGEHHSQLSKNSNYRSRRRYEEKSFRTHGRTYGWTPNGPLWDKLYHEPFTISNTSLVWCFGIFPIY